MVDLLSKTYGLGGIQPTKPTNKPDASKSKKAEETDSVPAEGAAKLIPNLADKVEISEAALEKARAVRPERTMVEESNAIQNSWYSAGFRMAAEESGSA